MHLPVKQDSIACLFKIFFLVLLQAEPLSLADHKHKHKARVASFDKAQFLFPLWVHHWVHCGYNVGRLWVDYRYTIGYTIG